MGSLLSSIGSGFLLTVALLIAYSYIQDKRRNPAGLPYPPGPKGYPVIGNLFDIPNAFIYKRFREMSRELNSDIIHLQVFGFHLIVCNSKGVADDLLDKRSSIYSDRPRMPMMVELMGFGWSLGFTPYNDWWKHSRKLFHKHFQPSAVPQFRPKKIKAAHGFLRQLIDSPADFHEHMQLMAGSTILDIAYGLDIRTSDDPYLKRAEECLKIIDQAGNPGSFLVDIIPALKYVPEWMPGASFKRKAREWRGVAERFYTVPFEFVKDSMSDGTVKSSFTSLALRDISEKDDRKYQEELIKCLGGTMYTAGADTTVSIILTFFLAMLMNPDAQTKAQQEIDRVIGADRLPNFDDESKLPYVSALAKEVFRWQQVAPFAIPHRLMEDDVYNGYFLPKDSIILGNAWGILHDDRLFPDPFAFKPERFVGPDADPRLPAAVDYAFGFGRRVCPGRWMAHSFIWIVVASVLSTFRIEKAVRNGTVIEPTGAFTPGILASPEKFECTIKPRSKEAETLIRATGTA
ncbi:CyP450 monooxygenase [Multifurca ochricompacta]|uniref:CyP450 monooxygenase n=1 Tax=Multifurca ochricompacta TaxID=376703 RepID=A0AAD4LZ47_9AGAM|nr:CyP450 monooxygenase [Multifurca ochricompacta]